jgi:hypothetical protein
MSPARTLPGSGGPRASHSTMYEISFVFGQREFLTRAAQFLSLLRTFSPHATTLAVPLRGTRGNVNLLQK